MSLDGVRRGQSGFVVLNYECLPWVGEGLAPGAFLIVSPNPETFSACAKGRDQRSRTVVDLLGWCRSAFSV